MTDALLERVLHRDRLVVITALIAISALAWGYLVWLAADMHMDGMQMAGFRMVPAGVGLMAPMVMPWRWFEFVLVFCMWVVMMVGMMLPSAAPMILIYARIGRQAKVQEKPFASTGWFAAGYLLAWVGFSLAATGAQWAFDRTALLDAKMAGASNVFGGVILIATGVYQWTSLKDVCLRQCQTPFVFIQRHGGFRGEVGASVLLGWRHGTYCVGCCWMLMALLFVGGVMNVFWIAAIASFVLAEKVLPIRSMIPRIAGLTFIAAGSWLLFGYYRA
jgi:predicted metal-binding membrane protein